MMMLLTYDVNLSEKDGERRLRKVAKICENYGVRVQNSVFELLIDPTQFIELKARLEKVIDMEMDSVRFYRLGDNWENRVETLGRQKGIKQGDTLIL